MMPAMSRWWVRAGGNVYGPVEAQTLIDSLRTGRLLPSDLACREEGRDWLLVSAVPEVAGAFAMRPRPRPTAEQDPWSEPVWMVGNLDGEILAGPLSLAAVNEEVARRKLTGDELLARVGNTSWRPMADIAREHKDALSSRPPPVGLQAAVMTPAPTPVAAAPPAEDAPTPARGSAAAPAPMHVLPPARLPPRSSPSLPPARPSRAPPLPSRRPPAQTQLAVAPAPAPPLAPTPLPTPAPLPKPAPRAVAPAPPPRAVAPTPSAPVADGIEWWIARGGPIEGPLTSAQLRQALAAGAIEPETPACRGDRQEWRAVTTFTELRAGLPSRPPPLPTRR
jgi:hypothetical protein